MVDLSSGPPPIPPELVEWLEAIYPDRFPPEFSSLAPVDLGRLAGRLEVVKTLRMHLDRQHQIKSKSTPTSTKV